MDLKALAKRWRKEPKKFLTKLVDDVWPIDLELDISFINSSGYFHKVLLKYFDASKATPKHVILIAKYIVFDATIEDPGVSQCCDAFLDDIDAFEAYFRLLLQLLDSSTFMDIKADDVEEDDDDVSVTPLFEFLALMVDRYLFKPHIKRAIMQIFGFKNWKYLPDVDQFLTQVPNYVKTIYEKELELDQLKIEKIPFIVNLLRSDSTSLSKKDYQSLIEFLVVCLRHLAIRSQLNPMIKKFGFLSSVPLGTLNRNLLKYYIYYPIDDFMGTSNLNYETERAHRFFSLQNHVYVQDETNPFALIPSIYDSLQNETEMTLKNLDHNSLKGFLGLDLTSDRLIKEISDSVFTNLYTSKENLNVDFTDWSNFAKIDIKSIKGRYLTVNHFVQSNLLRLLQEWINTTVDNVKQAFTRQFKLRKQSKYISSFTTKEGDFSSIQLPKGSTLFKDLSQGAPILLINKLNQDEYSKMEYEKEFGVYSMSNCTVESVNFSNGIIKLSQVASKFNYIMKLTDFPLNFTYLSEVNLELPSYLESILLLDINENSHASTNKLTINVRNAENYLNKHYKRIQNSSSEPKKKKVKLSEDATAIVHEKVIVDSISKTYSIEAENGSERSNEIDDVEGLLSCLSEGITAIRDEPNSKWLDVILDHLTSNFPSERILIVSQSVPIFDKANYVSVGLDTTDKIKALKEEMNETFRSICELSKFLKLPEVLSESVEHAEILLKLYVEPLWFQFLKEVKTNPTVNTLKSKYPFPISFKIGDDVDFKEGMLVITRNYGEILHKFEYLKKLAPLEMFGNQDEEKEQYLIKCFSSVVALSVNQLKLMINNKTDRSLNFDTIIMPNAHFTDEFTSILPFYFIKPKRFILLGNDMINQNSLFSRLVKINDGRKPNEKQFLFGTKRTLTELLEANTVPWINYGFDKIRQKITVLQEKATTVHNIIEAEYLVSLYKYMRNIGYPKEKISIVAISPIQLALIKEMFERKCGVNNSNYGVPEVYDPTELYAKSEVDYVLVSAHGYSGTQLLSAIARISLIAKLGMYLLGNFSDQDKGSKLKIRVGEKFGGSRSKQVFTIQDEKHLANYVEQLEKNKH